MPALLGLLASRFKQNPVGFAVAIGRFLYSISAGTIILAWYTGWRNKKGATGADMPIPGLDKRPSIGGPSRNDPSLPGSIIGDFPQSAVGVPPLSPGKPGSLIMYDGKPVAAWIVPILKYARAHGWRGNVTSGYRSVAEQAMLKRTGAGNNPVADPGKSNHNFTDFPSGAVDVTMAPQLSAILLRSPYASTLVWAGAKDPVHFSHPHDGGY